MPIYEYYCAICDFKSERMIKVAARDSQTCNGCGFPINRLISPTPGRVKGRADGKVVGGPDQFTADVLGYKVKDLPDALKVNKKNGAP